MAALGIAEPMADDIPCVFYGASIPQDKTDIVMSFRYVSKTLNFAGFCETKAQGTSSMGYPKKNQTTKLFADLGCTDKHKINFRNWGEQNKFCLKANWIDLSHARNIVAAWIWGDVVRSRPNFNSIPELLRTSPNMGAIDGFPVKVFSGGEYQGRYTLNIPKDKWMANMDDKNPNHSILCAENYGSGCFRAPALIDGSDWSDEIHDVCPENIKARWNEVISFVMNSTDDEFVANLDSYIDVESAIDYYLFGMAICHLDGFGKNQLYFTYDGVRWYASAYDMDSTFGLYWNGTSLVPVDYSRESFEDYVSTGSSGDGNLLYIRIARLFHERLVARWEELRKGALSESNIIYRIEEFCSIAPPHLIAEDYAATTANGAFTGIPSKDTNNVQQIRAYALGRLKYADQIILGIAPNLWKISDKTYEHIIQTDPTVSTPFEYGKIYMAHPSGQFGTYESNDIISYEYDGDNVTMAILNTGYYGRGLAMPIELIPGENYSISYEVTNKGALWVLFYDENKVYQGNKAFNDASNVGTNTFSTVFTVPDYAHFVVLASCHDPNPSDSGLKTIFKDIVIKKA